MATFDYQQTPGNRSNRDIKVLAATLTPADFTTTGDRGVIFAIPRGSVLVGFSALVRTIFNGTTPDFKFGTKSDDDAFVTAAAFDSDSAKYESFTTGVGTDTGSSDVAVYATATWGTNKPTAGEVVIFAHYIEYGAEAGGPYLGQVNTVGGVAEA